MANLKDLPEVTANFCRRDLIMGGVFSSMGSISSGIADVVEGNSGVVESDGEDDDCVVVWLGGFVEEAKKIESSAGVVEEAYKMRKFADYFEILKIF